MLGVMQNEESLNIFNYFFFYHVVIKCYPVTQGVHYMIVSYRKVYTITILMETFLHCTEICRN